MGACATLLLGLATWLGPDDEPTISRNFTAELNAEILALPEIDRAWPLYRKAFGAILPPPEDIAILDEVRLTTDPRWDAMAAYLHSQSDHLRLVREAAARPRLGYIQTAAEDPVWSISRGVDDIPAEPPPASSNSPVFHWNRYYIGALRSLVRALSADARVAAVEGEPRRAVDDLMALAGMAAQLHAQRDSVADDTCRGVLYVWRTCLFDVLTSDGKTFKSEDLFALDRALSRALGRESFHTSTDAEAVLFADVIQRCYSDDGRGNGRLLAHHLDAIQPLANPADEQTDKSPPRLPEFFHDHPAVERRFWQVVPSRKEITDEYDRQARIAAEAASRPMWEWKELPGDSAGAEIRAENDVQLKFMVLGMFRPEYGKMAERDERVTQIRDAVFVALAVERFRRDMSRLPIALDELIPEFLPAIPPDRFDGMPIRYRTVSDAFCLYSVGADRDDDLGVASVDAIKWVPRQGIEAVGPSVADGDWVLWPPP